MKRRFHNEFRLTPEEIVMLTLAGEVYKGWEVWRAKYGWDPARWPHRGFVIYTRPNHRRFTATWDKNLGWIEW